MKRLVTALEIFIQCIIFYSLAMYFFELEFAGTENSREGALFFLWSERVVAIIFSIEYLVRWYFSKDRIKYPITPMAIIDLVAVLPFYIGFMVDLRVLRLIRTLRILRLFKFYRYNEALRSFVVSFNKIRNELQVIGIAIIFLVFLSATIEFEFERAAQPEMFGKYSDAIWWSIITLTTVGYGDMFPITPGGRITAVLTLIMGLGIFGTFLSLVGSAFLETLQEKSKTIHISETAQHTLIEMQEANGLPTDDDSLKDLVGDFIATEYQKHKAWNPNEIQP
jgi:voltage-gated potassium channel